jgi:hypothetical protein
MPAHVRRVRPRPARHGPRSSGSVINTAQLKDKTWFIILLVTGLLSFGFIAMIIYLIAGPDDSPPHPATTAARDAPPRDLRRWSA